MGQIIKVQRHVSPPVCDIRGRIYNSVAGGIIVQQLIQAYHQHSFVNYKKGCTQLQAASDKVYQLFAHGRWFSSGTLASSTTKTGRHDRAEILLKVALNTIDQIKTKNSKNVYKCTS